jgi:hypothetical protein
LTAGRALHAADALTRLPTAPPELLDLSAAAAQPPAASASAFARFNGAAAMESVLEGQERSSSSSLSVAATTLSLQPGASVEELPSGEDGGDTPAGALDGQPALANTLEVVAPEPEEVKEKGDSDMQAAGVAQSSENGHIEDETAAQKQVQDGKVQEVGIVDIAAAAKSLNKE